MRQEKSCKTVSIRCGASCFSSETEFSAGVLADLYPPAEENLAICTDINHRMTLSLFSLAMQQTISFGFQNTVIVNSRLSCYTHGKLIY